MTKVGLHLDDSQYKQLKKLAEDKGTSMSDLLRRALERYLEKQEKK